MAVSVEFSSNLTKRNYLWTEFVSELTKRSGKIQFHEYSTYYLVWFYEANSEVFTCDVFKGEVPSDILSNLTYTQEQSDLDQIDFEFNYKNTSNNSTVQKSLTGVPGQSPAKGLGGFTPDPTTNPYQPNTDEVVGIYADASGALVTRGLIITDEGSFRDDFVGSSLVTNLTGTLSFTNGSSVVTGSGTSFTTELNRNNYIKLNSDDYTSWVLVERITSDTSLKIVDDYIGTTGSGVCNKTMWIEYDLGSSPGSTSTSSSKLTLSTGTDSSGGVALEKSFDYLPLLGTFNLSLSQRIANQTSFFGFRDGYSNPQMYCDVLFDGTDNTKIKFRSAWNGDEQLTLVNLPTGLLTSSFLSYKIDLSPHYCALLINGVLSAKHDLHIPDMYSDLSICFGVENSGATSNTDMIIDTVYFSNTDQIQVASTFVEPIPVFTREDQHSIYGTLTTSSTSADQVILSYDVPDGKIFYIIGYKIDSSGTLSGSPVKIGKNTVTTEPGSPGEVDSNIFRAFNLGGGLTTGEVDFGGNPRKIGVGGDTIKVTVTPSGSLSSDWRAALDFVLR